MTLSDPDIERVRRNHLNDIENIVPFAVIGFFYVAMNPNARTALWHFRVFFLSRIFHTIAYQVKVRLPIRSHRFISVFQLPLPQPSRALGFLVGYGTTVSMAIQLLRVLFR